MYCVIDRDALVFMPIKHTRLDVVTNLVWLQATCEGVHIFDIYARAALASFTDMELMILYKNTTGELKAPRIGQPLRNILLELAERIEPQLVQVARLEMQAAAITEADSGKYLYNPDALKPSPMPDTFVPPKVVMARSENESLVASQPRVRPAKSAVPAPPPPPLVTTPAQPPAPPPAAAATSAPCTKPAPATQAPAPPPPPAPKGHPDIISPWLKKS